MEKPLHKILWLIVPLAFLVFQIVIELTLSHAELSAMHSEGGFHEVTQFIIMAVAFLLSLSLFFLKPWKISPWLVPWIGIAALASLYVAGEEVSWGQHILNWSTPEYWAQINDQGETNLHNTSSWLDQKPRLILLIGSIVGGIIIPFLLRFKPSIVPQQFSVIYPPATLGLSAAVALGINLTDKIKEAISDAPFFARGSEVEEVYLFYFVLLYLIVLRARIMQH